MSSCTFFGHRDCYRLDQKVLSKAILDLIARGVNVFFVGNQGRFDAMVYSCLKAIRKTYPDIRISVVLAYLPTKRTEGEDMTDTIYPEIEGHPKFAIERRNRWMIDHSNYCLCYIDHTWGGAYKFAVRAKHYGLHIINLGDIEF